MTDNATAVEVVNCAHCSDLPLRRTEGTPWLHFQGRTLGGTPLDLWVCPSCRGMAGDDPYRWVRHAAAECGTGCPGCGCCEHGVISGACRGRCPDPSMDCACSWTDPA